MEERVDPSPHLPIFGSFNSAVDKDMMSKVLTKLEIQFSDGVEKNVGKEEIAHFEQFLLFPQCFQNLSVVHVLK